MTIAYINLIGGLVAAGAVLVALGIVLVIFRRHRQVATRAGGGPGIGGGAHAAVPRRDLHASAVITSLTDGLVTIADDGTVVEMNPAAEHIFGVTAEALTGQPATVILPTLAEVAPCAPCAPGLVERAGTAEAQGRFPRPVANAMGDIVLHGRRSDGGFVPLTLSLTQVVTSRGSYTIAMVRDVTERVLAEEMESMMRSIDNHLLLGSSQEDLSRELCDRVAKLFGLPVVWIGLRRSNGMIALTGRGGRASECLSAEPECWDDSRDSDKDDCDADRGPAARALRFGRACRLEPQETAPAWVTAAKARAVLALPLWTQKEVVGVICVAGDHAQVDQPMTLRRLETLAARLGAAFQTLQDQAYLKLQSTAMASAANAIFITDAKGRIEWVNRSFITLTGYTEEEVIGRLPSILKSGVQDNDVYAELWESITRGRVWRGEMVEKRKDGRRYVVDQTVTPILDDQGNVTHYVAVHEDVTARKKAEERIRYLSNYDTLTRLPNRVLFRDRLYQAVVQARRNHTGLAVMFIDLDHFNRVNDTLGHASGDQLLMTIASRINASAEEADTVARVGGDEFALIQPNISSADSAAVLARRIADVVRTPVDLGGQEVRVGANVGIAMYPQDGTDPDNLMKNADMAMYRAIKSEDEDTCFFSSEMNAEAAVRLGIEGDLRRALMDDGSGELFLNFQLQYGMADGRPVGVETLVRWNHPRLGLIPPGRFIPVAEDSGLIIELGDYVLREALRCYAGWRAAGAPALTMAVNISAVQFKQKGLEERITSLLADTGVPPCDLELELTESMLMQDAQEAVRLLGSLSELGVRLAIDDFGTGYSSLSYLKQFKVDKLKVDQSFVRHLTEDSNDAVIARAIINLGHSLGLEVIAEGVETEAQYDYLKREGCDTVQGYLLARPESADTVLKTLLEGNYPTVPSARAEAVQG